MAAFRRDPAEEMTRLVYDLTSRTGAKNKGDKYTMQLQAAVVCGVLAADLV